MKPRPQPLDARSLALSVLLQVREGDAFAQDLLDQALHRHPLSVPDRRLATQLVYGVLRRRATLDALVRPFIDRPWHRVQPWLQECLRLGAFQLALLTHVPPHAAVHATVQLAAFFGQPRAKGFLNGILRRVTEVLTEETAPGPAAAALPTIDGNYRRLTKPLLPDPQEAPADYLAGGLSLPVWLAQRWLQRLGWEESLRLGWWFAGQAPLFLRVNPLRTSRDFLLARLQLAQIPCEKGMHPQAVRLLGAAAIRDLPGFDQGHFVVQDESAMQVASALQPQPGWRVLDLCAGPGGKTTHLAELLEDRGEILACDIAEERLQPLAETADRLGLTCIRPVILDARRHEEPPAGPFDAVLVDVPCSNTGVLGRRPEVRWRLRETDLAHLVPLQTKLLLWACERVRPGGAVVYSTCSIEPEENRGVVDVVLRAFPALHIEAESIQVPGRPADGGYWARLRAAGG